MTEATVMRNKSSDTETFFSRDIARARSLEKLRSCGGFTLIEALISLLILSVIFLGLQASLMMAITVNTENLLRNEAMNLAKERMDRYRIQDGTPPNSETITRQIRNYQVIYTIDNSGYKSGKNILPMVVRWNFQNEGRTLEYTSYVGG